MKKRNLKRNESTKHAKLNYRFAGALIILIAAFCLRLNPGYMNKTLNAVLNTNCDYNMMFSDISSVIYKHSAGNRIFKLPADGTITSPFGERQSPDSDEKEIHTGIDIDIPENTDVKASCKGRVTRVEENEFYGKFIMIDHGENLLSLYGHLNEQMVKPGDEVGTDTVIGLSGNTGRSTGPHLHFEIRKNNECVDPGDYLL